MWQLPSKVLLVEELRCSPPLVKAYPNTETARLSISRGLEGHD